jgi:hypothetical protein
LVAARVMAATAVARARAFAERRWRITTMRLINTTLIVIIPLLAAATTTRGQVARSWIRPAGGNFADASNWDPFGIPGAGDGAEFGLPSAYTVIFPTHRTTAGAHVGAGTVTWDLGEIGAVRTYSVGGLDVIGGGGAGPTLIARDGNVSAGTVRVQNGGHLHIGATETGQMPAALDVANAFQITSGGRVTLNNFHSNHVINANADVLIDGGSFRRSGGGNISTGGLRLGAGRTITVQNAGSFDHGGTFGLNGNTLHVRSGGIAHTDGLEIGTTGAGTVLVEGAGSRLSMDLDFAAPLHLQSWGAAGHAASVEVRGGATGLLKGGLRMASDGGTSTFARLTIDGPGTTFTHTDAVADQIIIGHASSGSAELIVRNGAAFNSEAGIYVGSGFFIKPTGRVRVESDATFAVARLTRDGGQFDMLGGTVQFDVFKGNLLNQGGTMRPGYRPDSIAGFIEGNYTQQPAGSLAIEIGGVLAGETKPLVVSGNAVIAGALDLTLANDFVPVLGNTFEVVQSQFGNVGGRFARVNGTLPTEDLGLAVTYTPTKVLVRVSIPGDANLDNVVNLQDFNALASNFAQTGRTWVQGDFTGDGLVNLQDFNRLAGHFGFSAGPEGPTPDDWAALASAVPEAGIMWISLLPPLCLLRRRRCAGRSAAL